MTQCMYMGPSIPGVVKRNTVFIGRLPKELTAAAEKLSDINNLVIPVEKITEATKSLSEQGSVESVSYNNILKHLKGEIRNVNL
ncbi:MAG: hypothetical protein NC223_03165 [Butyrivibrio sp.]|nr:hypothetical protein [Butyrivibrio sp.]